jgi:hypothetical protein
MLCGFHQFGIAWQTIGFWQKMIRKGDKQR